MMNLMVAWFWNSNRLVQPVSGSVEQTVLGLNGCDQTIEPDEPVRFSGNQLHVVLTKATMGFSPHSGLNSPANRPTAQPNQPIACNCKCR